MTSTSDLKQSTLMLMATATAMSVANLYYNQPLLEQIRETFAARMEAIAWIPTLTQLGYALGMLFIVPLGDMFERRRLVLLFTLLAAGSCVLVATAPAFNAVVIGSLLIGLTTMTPQLLIPFAASLARPERRGKVVGTMVSGLLLGILLARTVAGFVGQAFGWRSMFGLAAIILLILTGLLAFFSPKSVPTYKGTYTGLLSSVLRIFFTQKDLREAAFFGAMLFGSFSAFWSTLIHLMESPAFHLGARAVGLFGLLGAGAAAASPIVGTLSDRFHPRRTTGIMILVAMVSFVIFGFSSTSLIGLSLGVLVMDIGVQGGHVSNQSRIFALMPSAQSRIQTSYMFCYFVGGALGSFVGTWAWERYAWWGVCGSALVFLSLAYLKYALAKTPQQIEYKT